MNWILQNLGSMLTGIGLILLLTLVVRGNLRGSKAGSGGCAGCSCAGGCAKQQAINEVEQLEQLAQSTKE